MEDVWTMHGVRKCVDVAITEHNVSTVKLVRLRRGQLVSAFYGLLIEFFIKQKFFLCVENFVL